VSVTYSNLNVTTVDAKQSIKTDLKSSKTVSKVKMIASDVKQPNKLLKTGDKLQ